MGQFDMCCVKHCKSKRRHNKGIWSFFRLPFSPQERREAWIKFSGRKSSPKKSWKVCSTHFVKKRPSTKPKDVDYIPTQNGVEKHKHKRSKSAGKSKEDKTDTQVSPVDSENETLDLQVKDEPNDSYEWPVNSEKDKHSDNEMVKTENRTSDGEEGMLLDETKKESEVESDSESESSDCSSSSSSSGATRRKSSRSRKEPKKKEKPVRSAICTVCGKDLLYESRLKFHVRTHDILRNEEGFICPVCGKVMVNRRSLTSHIRNAHRNCQKYMCDYCGKTFNTVSGLKDHCLTHTGEKQFQCSECGKAFARKNMLWNHELRIHNKADNHEPLTCPFCGMKFLLESRLKSHMDKHTKPTHQCPYCPSMFRHANNLKTHVKGIHEGDDRFKCPHCMRRFGNSYNLKVHVRIHTGEKPYYCNLCQKGFSDICNFRRHEQKCNSSGQVLDESADVSESESVDKPRNAEEFGMFQDKDSPLAMKDESDAEMKEELPIPIEDCSVASSSGSSQSPKFWNLPHSQVPFPVPDNIHKAYMQMLEASQLTPNALAQEKLKNVVPP